jgi:uncharacterized protein YecA (UPF0149 family)
MKEEKIPMKTDVQLDSIAAQAYREHFNSLSVSEKRNKLCGCGSGIKHKKCCLNKPSKYTEEELVQIFTIPKETLLERIRKYNSGLSMWFSRLYRKTWNKCSRLFKKLKGGLTNGN